MSEPLDSTAPVTRKRAARAAPAAAAVTVACIVVLLLLGTGVRTDFATGYGVGARFRTPIGPIRADLAYGARDSDWRLHFSVGYGF